MDTPSQPVSQGIQPSSVFSGQKYNPNQNTVTHYKAGKPKKKKCKSSKCKSVFS